MKHNSVIYFAGMFDGEGSIQIEVQSPRANRKYHYFSLRIIVTNTCLELIEWLKAEFGGSYKQRTKIEGRKLTYDWCLYSIPAAELIAEAFPYLIVKRERALIFLEFAKTIGKTGWNVSPETREYRAQLYEKLRVLNKQGAKTSKPLRLVSLASTVGIPSQSEQI